MHVNLAMRSRLRRAAMAVTLGLSAIFATANAAAQAPKFFKNYYVTGDYVAAGVGLRGTGLNGFATGAITIGANQVPANAEIVAAYLYWQTVATSGTPPAYTLAGARFKGNDISGNAVLLGATGTAVCGANDTDPDDANTGPKSVWSYRADVLRYFPRIKPADVTQPVEVRVAGQHEVKLPDAGAGKSLPSTLGANLVIVYRVAGYDPASAYQAPRQPLRSIVLYDGGYTLNQQSPVLELPLAGFYEASRTAPNARLSLMVSDVRRSTTERVLLSSTASLADAVTVATNPFSGLTGLDVVTFPNVPLEPGAMQARLRVDSGSGGAFSCLNGGAVVLSTVVQDRDADGLLDVWESRNEWATKPARLGGVYASWPLTDPNGAALPDLAAMGASPDTQDVFVQVDYMTGANGHSHLPTRAALDAVAVAFRNAGPRSTRASGPINVHFDVGNHYQPVAPPSCSTLWTPDCAIVPAALARGGNAIAEAPCSASGLSPSGKPCAFPGYAGVVGWKSGLRAYRDTSANAACTPDQAGQPGCEARFPRNRKDIFHYALFAHALGLPSADNPRVPRKTSGIADSSGGDMLVTLGLWDGEVGSSFVQGATLLHELGHNFGLRHGGVVAAGSTEPNCKPNYQSVMNYLFQVRGLLTPAGVATLDFSRAQLPALSESALVEASGLGAPSHYLARWYAPRAGSFIDTALGTTPATRRCDGTPVAATDPAYVRVDGDPRVAGAIDWNANGSISGVSAQDANFDGAPIGQTFLGADDYATMDLRQVGARRSLGSQQLTQSVVVDPALGNAAGGGLSLDAGYGDLGYGDLGYGDLGYGDLGYGDLGYGDLGYGDLGYGDLGYGDLGASPDGSETVGDVDVETASAVGGNAASAVTAIPLACRKAGGGGADASCGIEVSWARPNVGIVLGYKVYRVLGASVTPTTFATRTLVADLATPAFTSFIDAAVKRGKTYTYFVIVVVRDANGVVVNSGASNFATATAPGPSPR